MPHTISTVLPPVLLFSMRISHLSVYLDSKSETTPPTTPPRGHRDPTNLPPSAGSNSGQSGVFQLFLSGGYHQR